MNKIEISDSSPLVDWTPIFEAWINEIDKSIINSSGLEAAYVHAEQANITLFSHAALNCGLSVILELLGGKRSDRSDARLDLCIFSRDTIDLVESKFAEFEIESHPRPTILKSRIDRALDEVARYENNSSRIFSSGRKIRRVGLCFISPFTNKEDFIDNSNLDRLLTYIRDYIQPDAIAWTFPESAKGFKYWGRTHPGVIVFAKALVDSGNSP